MSAYTPMDFDPFDGDYGGDGPSDRVLRDKMLPGRKAYACFHCAGPIAIGEVHRYRAEVYDGEMMQWRWCADCCAAMVEQMAVDYGPDDPAIDPHATPFESRAGLHKAMELKS